MSAHFFRLHGHRPASPSRGLHAAWAHVRALWPRWTLLPTAPFVLWTAYCLFVRREARWELAILMILTPLLAYWNERTKRLFVGLFPFLLVGLLYDAMRFVQGVGVSAATVHVCDLRAAEMSWFGITVDGVRMTVHDWLQPHATRALDLWFAVPYGLYILVAVGYGFYLGFVDRAALARYGWTFFAVNLAGFIGYHVYPAAPPWYFHAHGCAVDLQAVASEGANLARVDRMIGFGWFHGLYGRSHDVFGAMPSLHVTYPVLMILAGWRRHGLLARVVMFVWAASMIGGAIYLDHHWILDVVLGLSLLAACWALVARVLAPRRASAKADAKVAATS